MKHGWLFILAAGVLPAPAWAAPPNVDDLEDATEVMQDCAGVAGEISAMKVPDGHARARAAFALNRKVTDSKVRLSVDAAQDEFIAKMLDAVARLDICGINYRRSVAVAEGHLAALAKDDSLSDDDAADIADEIQDYNDAKDKLEAALAALSSNRQIQAYVQRVLVMQFFAPLQAKGGK